MVTSVARHARVCQPTQLPVTTWTEIVHVNLDGFKQHVIKVIIIFQLFVYGNVF